MWEIKLYGKGIIKKFEILEDDITFVAVLKREETVHNLDNTYVRCSHLCVDNNGNALNFQMTLLEATSIELKFPLFVEDGIMGRWKLVKPENSKTPNIILINNYDDVNEFLKESKSLDNVDWIKQFYLDF